MINYNSRLITSEEFRLGVPNRGLYFGDGIFETMVIEHHNVRFFELHWERIKTGLALLGIDLPFDSAALRNQIQEVYEKNLDHARIKLTIWRDGAGKYAPETNKAAYLIESALNKPRKTMITEAAISKNVKLQRHVYSHLKSISALTYVLASKERNDRNLEELILETHDGNLAEASSSNLFFYNSTKALWSTPPLSSGCIAGVARQHLINQMKNRKLNFTEENVKFAELGGHYSIFLTNVTGVSQLLKLEHVHLSASDTVFTTIQSLFKEGNS